MFLFQRGKNPSFQKLSIDEYKQNFNKKTKHKLIDVREKSEYKNGHLPGAVNIPLSQIRDHADKLPRDIPVVLVCATGNRSGMAARSLSKVGFENLYNLMGGTMAWSRKGYKITR
jgi:rhodanese-related sulfurtransferase